MKGPPSHWTTMKKLIYLKAARGSGPSWVWQFITGTAPLTLLDAVAHPLHSLTQYGLCVQDGTPTPAAPVDILCNNGKIMVSRNMCDMVEANVVVGKYINNSGVESSDTANFYYATYIPVTPGETYTMSTSSSIWYFSVMQYDSSKNFLRRTIWGATNTPVGTEKTFSVGADCAYILFGSNMRKATISLADVLAVDWMLTQGETAETYHPYKDWWVEGTPEVLTVGGQNLVDLSAVTDGFYYDPNGVLVEASVARLTDYIPVKAGQKYTVYTKAARVGTAANVRCNLFNSAQEWMAQSAFVVNSGAEAVSTITPAENGYLRVSANYTGTGARVDWSTLQIVRGEYTLATMPPYEPYATPQTVTDIPMLLGVGDYKDEAELIAGVKTGKVGIYVFTGEEAFIKGSSFYTSNTSFLPSKAGSITPICTHFRGISSAATRVADSLTMTVNGPSGTYTGCVYFYADRSLYATGADFGNMLAAQFRAGTPVIVLYPLATETTEQTTAHSLHTTAGTNVVDVSAAVEGVTVAVEYAKGAS